MVVVYFVMVGVLSFPLVGAAQARGLGTCAEGALGTWARPVREAFDVPPAYKLLCGMALGWPSEFVGRQVAITETTWAAWMLRSTEEAYLLESVADERKRMPVLVLSAPNRYLPISQQ